MAHPRTLITALALLAGILGTRADAALESEFDSNGLQPWATDVNEDLPDVVALLQISSGMVQPDPVPAAAIEAPHPGRLSTAVRCFVVLTIQYFAIYLLGLMAKVSLQLGAQKTSFHVAMEKTTRFANMLPMVGVLIIASQLRAEQLSKQLNPAFYGIPQWWVGDAVLVAVIAGIVAMVFQILSSLSATADDSETGTSRNTLASSFFAACRAAATVVQFLALGIAITGDTFMGEPFDIWIETGRISISSAVACMLILAIQYFVVHLIALATGGVDELGAVTTGKSLVTTAAKSGVVAQNLAPMIAVIIAASRVRILAAAEPGEERWAEIFCYIAVYGLLFHTIIAMAVTGLMEATGTKSGNAVEEVSASHVSGGIAAFKVVRGLALLTTFVGVAGIFTSVLVRRHNGWAQQALTTVLTCVMVLTAQYFLVHLFSFASSILEKGRPADAGARSPFLVALDTAKETNNFCPILCVLFLAARIRAFQINVKALPQAWVQDCMYGCMWFSLLHLILVIGLGVVGLRADAETEEEKQRRAGAGAKFLACCLSVAVVGMYAGVIAIIVGIFCMSPESVSFPA